MFLILGLKSFRWLIDKGCRVVRITGNGKIFASVRYTERRCRIQSEMCERRK